MYENEYLPSAADHVPASADIDGMYPDVFKRMKPHVENTVNGFDGGPLTEGEMERMTEEAVTASGIMGDPPRGHNRDTVRDAARGLLLASLDRRRRRPERFFPHHMHPPIFFHPFWGWGFPGWRR